MSTKKETQAIVAELKRLGSRRYTQVRQNFYAGKIYNEVLQDIIRNTYTDEFFRSLRPHEYKVPEAKHQIEAELNLLINPGLYKLLTKYTKDLLKLRIEKRTKALQQRAEKKRRHEDRKREREIEMRVKKKVEEFQRSNGKSSIFNNIRDSKVIGYILKYLKFRPGYASYVSNGSYQRAIRQDDIPRLHSDAEKLLAGEDYETQDYEGKTFVEWTQDVKKIIISQFVTMRQKPQGAFFKYINKSPYDLTKYGIFTEVNKEHYRMNCLELAFKHSGVMTEQEIDYMRTLIRNRIIPMKDLKKLAEDLKIMITVKSEKHIFKYGSNELRKINLALIEQHYFLYEKTIYTSFTINHYEVIMKHLQESEKYKIPELITSAVKARATYYEKSADVKYKVDSYTLVKKLQELKLFEPIELDYKILETQYHTDFKDIKNLHYDNCTKLIDNKPKEHKYDKIFYADFETITTDVHKAYMICAIDDQNNEYTFYGENSGKQFYDIIPKNSLIYFHNMGYDISFIVKYMNLSYMINNGSKTKYVRDYKKKFDLRDSLAIIPEPLKKFTKMFDIKAKKEIMPYALYTEDTVKLASVPFTQALLHIKPNEQKEFEEIAAPYIKEGQFDHIRYAQFYCMQDCKVLKEGMEKFNIMLQQVTKLNANNYVSLPAISYDFGINTGVFFDVDEICGIPRMFIQRAVSGGRCMTKENKVYHVEHDLDDFDAVSLYPSAMSSMGFLKGKPKIIEGNHYIKICDDSGFADKIIPRLSLEFLLNYASGFFIEIKNIKVGKRRQFPLQSIIVDGIRNYTNDFAPEDTLVLDKIATEDFINFQEATFDIIRGYYFDEGRTYKIKELMTTLFNERVSYKKVDNPVEQIYKLLMNSFYGKTITKERNTDIKTTNNEQRHQQFIRYNSNFIKEFTQIAEGKYVYKVDNPINKHFNACHIGAEVLSMSKRLMNQVMCLAEDIGANIWYQDTDSMHIDRDKVDILAKHFEEKYKRTLIGKELCQFHPDFPEDAHATESYFLAKKIYIDKLVVPKKAKKDKHDCEKVKKFCDFTNNLSMQEEYNIKTKSHIRMKGVPEACITQHEDPIELYKQLYEGATLTFDLAKVKPCFKRDLGFQYKTIYKMERSISIRQKSILPLPVISSENNVLSEVIEAAHDNSLLREIFSGD